MGRRPGPGRRRWEPGRSSAGHAAVWPALRVDPAGRLVLVCAGAVLFALFASPASQFQTEFLRQQRHYSALDISVLQQVAGHDRRVRRARRGPPGGHARTAARRRRLCHRVRPPRRFGPTWRTAGSCGWRPRAGQFFLYATAPVLGVYGAELFATTSRARSAGLVAASSAVGGVSGLLAVGALAGHFGTLGPALGALAVGPLLLVVLLADRLPRAAGVTLEDLAPSPRGSGRRRSRPAARTLSRHRSGWTVRPPATSPGARIGTV